MIKRRRRPRKKNPTRLSRKEHRIPSSREWQLEDVVGVLFNPVYGYGKLLLPSEVVVAHVYRLNEELAERQKSQGRPFTLDELDEEFTALMDRLVAQGLCWHEQDVPAFISKEEWLETQRTAIQRLADGEDIVWGQGDESMSQGEMTEFDEDEGWGWYDGQCYACDLWGRVDDLMLCEECRTKLERDLIRQRDWDYSAWAFGLSEEGQEELYRQVIAQYGKELELIAPPEGTRKQRGSQRRKS